MSTTIDSLQIEIQSNSTNASQGIRDLAKSLGELKTNGTVTTAIKNLNSLSTALKNFTDASHATRSVGKLVGSLRQLKEVGSIASIGNSLTKLSGALKTLDGMDIDGVGPKILQIAEAVSPLSSLKAGGLSTMVNAISKIGKVTADLDDDKINAFAERIQRLNAVVEPLSAKMTTIQAGLKGINSNARSAGSSVRQMSDDLNASAINMSSIIHIVQSVVQWLQAAIEKFSQFMGQAIEWDGIAARFGRGFGPQAQETYEWIQRLNEEMGINVQQFMQYSSIYANMLTGFGVAAEDARKMALGYTELTYDIWAGYNDVYKTFEEASEAVKSAIAGEVEPIRRAGFTIVESTLEMTAAKHGLSISIEKATEAEKSYLRYLTLVDQAQAQSLVGTYAKELNTAEGLMRTFSQQLKSLSQAFGSLFLPALAAVMPYLQAFVEMLTSAVRWIASLFGIEIQGVDWSGYNSGVGEAVENTENLGAAADGLGGSLGGAAAAAKELKNATLGIDELNVISPSSASGGGGGGGSGVGGDAGSGFSGLDIDSLWDESIFAGIGKQVDEIKEKFKAWLPVIGTIAGVLAGLGLTSLIVSIGDAIAEMNVFKKAAAAITTLVIEAALVFLFADKYLESGNMLYLIGEALITAASGYLLFKAWGPAGATLSLGVSILAQLIAIKNSLADGTIDLDSPELWMQSITTMVIGAFGGMLIAKKTGFFAKEGFVIGLAATAALTLATIRLGAIESGEIDSGSVEAWILEIGSVITSGLTGKWLGSSLYKNGGPMGALIGVTAGLILNLVGTISVKGEDFGDSISDWINAGLTAAMTAFTAVKLWGIIGPTVTSALSGVLPLIASGISTALGGLGAAVAAIGGGWVVALIAAIVGLISLAIVDYDFSDIGYKLGQAFGKILKGLGAFFVNAGEIIAGIATAIKDAFLAAIDWVAETFEIDSVWDILDLIFNPVSWLTRILPKMGEVGKEVLPGLWQGIKDAASNFWDNIVEFFSGFVQGVKDELGIKSPSTVFAEIGGFLIEGLWLGISNLVSWIHEKLSGFVTDVITKVKGFFGISGSSSSVFSDIGDFLVQGLWKGISDLASWIHEKLSGFVTDAITKVKEFFGISGSSSSIFSEIGDFLVQGLWKGIQGKIDWIIEKIGGWVADVIKAVRSFFGIASPSKEFKGIGGYLVDGLWEGLKNGYSTLENNVEKWLDDLLSVFKDFDFSDALEDTWDWITGFFTTDKKSKVEFDVTPKNDSSQWWSDVKKWWSEKVGAAKDFTTKATNSASTWWSDVKKWWGEKVGSVSNFKTNVSNSSKTWWSNAKKWWGEKVGSVSNFRTNVSNSSKTWWSNVKKWWSGKVGTAASFKVNVQNNAKDWWNNVKKWWKQKAGSLSTTLGIKVPKIEVKWDKISAFGKDYKYPTGFKVTTAATGGMFDMGSLIWAGERGAEIVANAGGGKTGVMNVDQMADAVFEGVYAAVMAANRASQGDGSQSVNVYLDGKQITAAVEKRQRERGASIMGNQVYSFG